jgi:hypothetical protein
MLSSRKATARQGISLRSVRNGSIWLVSPIICNFASLIFQLIARIKIERPAVSAMGIYGQRRERNI